MIVVDASVVVTALGDDHADGDHARHRLSGERLAAPELIDLEVTSVLRRLVRGGRMPPRRAELALADLMALPLERVAHRPLLAGCWDLRDHLSTYDAAYATLAGHLGVVLVTADTRMAAAPGLPCEVELLDPRMAGPGIG